MPAAPGPLRLATVTVPAPDPCPWTFLRQAGGEPRGFWARGERWVAHRGVAVEHRAEEGGDSFHQVASWARTVAHDPILPSDSPRAPRIRFYGGFSFRADHAAAGVWEAFPASRFLVPAFELEGGAAGGAWLSARRLVAPSEDGQEALVGLHQAADMLLAELAPPAGTGSPAQQAPPFPGDSGGDNQVRAPANINPGAADRVAWDAAVTASLDAIWEGRLSKVVLARTLDVEADADSAAVAVRLWEQNRGGHVFLFEPEAGSALLGAPPETVAAVRDGVFRATAVAGSIRRGDSPREQAELAARLLASDKDRREQRLALEDMVARLAKVAHEIRTEAQPHVLTLPRIQHLETEIRAGVPPGTGVLDVLRVLHPTAAVCGYPRDAALAFLEREEPFQRGWYAGPVGWFDADGDGVFAPALRSAVLRDGSWRLFAGAGIVEGSVPAAEWEETAMKFTPMLEALAAAGAELSGRGFLGEEMR